MTKADFLQKLVRESDGCWLWRGNPSQRYPQVKIYGRIVTAHRYAYEVLVGEIPAGMEICHTCDTPRCCRPEHLFPATHRENMIDAARKGRWTKKPPRIKMKRSERRGDRAPFRKLSEAAVNTIRQEAAAGASKRLLAKRYGVSWTCIHRIILGQTWQSQLPP